MKHLSSSLIAASFFAVAAASSANADDRAALVPRGRYLVENALGCADCHSPRDQTGEIIAAQHLKGAPLMFAPTVPMPAWGAFAPAIAGLPTMSEQQAVHFLMTGQKPDGMLPRPPMPAFRLNREDAEAVAAYLASLK